MGYREFNGPPWARDLFITICEKHGVTVYHMKGKKTGWLVKTEAPDANQKIDAAWTEFQDRFASTKKPMSARTAKRRATRLARQIDGWREFRIRDRWGRKLFIAMFENYGYKVTRFKRARISSLAVKVADLMDPMRVQKDEEVKRIWQDFQTRWAEISEQVDKIVDEYIARLPKLEK